MNTSKKVTNSSTAVMRARKLAEIGAEQYDEREM